MSRYRSSRSTGRPIGMGRKSAATTWLAASIWLVTAAPLTAQACGPDPDIAPVEALNLVARLVTYVEGSFYSFGSGVVMGHSADMVHVATAQHVVQDAGVPVDSTLAYFAWDCARPVRAEVCPSLPPTDLDVTLLCVPYPDPDAVIEAWDWLGPETLAQGELVHPVGCPGGECWDVTDGDRVLRSDEDRVLFTTFFVAPGHSGGALFNEWFEITGIITAHSQPLAEAIPIRTALLNVCDVVEGDGDAGRCESSRFRLQNAGRRRGGYRLTLGLMGPMLGGEGGQVRSLSATAPSRFPSGRATLMFHPDQSVELHGGVTRLTPENVSFTAAMVGVGYTLRRDQGRLLFNPFIEGGVAHLDGRYDAGGYLSEVGSGGEPEYVEFWRAVGADVLGFGIGASIQAVLPAGFVLEAIGGLWNFNTPDTPADAVVPSDFLDVPSVYFGLGVRYGIR